MGGEKRIPPVDVVLPIYNSLTYVKECVNSLLAYTPASHYRLFMIDDHSDATTSHYLQGVAEAHTHVTVHRNSENIGFVKSCNRGIGLGQAPWVLLINSDVVVTPAWLERLCECMASDPSIASVNPLTNQASQINVPIAPGANFFGMDRVLGEASPRTFPDVVTGVGFCMLLRRAVLDEVGVFDEIYGRGYCEESDLCMRLTTHGYRTVVADHVYVYHKGRTTFTDRTERYTRNRAIFDSRWRSEYRRQYRAFRKADPLRGSRDLFRVPSRWDPMPAVWETARAALGRWRKRELGGVAKELARGAFRTVLAKRAVASPEDVARVTRPGRLRVNYVMQDLVVAGGVLSVIQLVNELILLGVEARIIALFEDPAIYDWTRLYTKPLIFRNEKELADKFPECDIAVATLWRTAAWVADAERNGKARAAAYFLQDYEPWFFPENDEGGRQAVRKTFSLIESKIVKSAWLREMLRKDGFDARIISLGMDLACFYPRAVPSDRPTVIAMVRPGTPRRGFQATIEALSLVKGEMPEVEIILFGDRFLSSHDIPFGYRDEGVVTDPSRLAALYSEADVFLDGSDFQGFGRCGLEAMACGAACVVTGVGGVTEYARHGENAWVVPPKSPREFASAVLRLLRDRDLNQRLVAEGRKTVQAYCHKREARETLAYFERIVEETNR